MKNVFLHREKAEDDNFEALCFYFQRALLDIEDHCAGLCSCVLSDPHLHACQQPYLSYSPGFIVP